eukprot:snap_masked-scaffold_51-processed-gene-1.29-mRNA-1 protein AED:1.00 eAED:1.00 QI:0/0/0/0/1/1/2/0/819
MILNFKGTFKESYQRNNKSARTKNLRCFPSCKSSGHCSTGFCGSPVVADLNLSNPEQVLSKGEIYTWGDFCSIDDTDMTELLKLREGNYEKVKEQERTRKSPTNPLIKGTMKKNRSDEKFELSFNVENIGWHYQWISKKTTNHYQHSFRVRVFLKEHGSDILKPLCIELSPKFKVHSKRKNLRQKKEQRQKALQQIPHLITNPFNRFHDEVTTLKSFFQDDLLKNLIDDDFLLLYKADIDRIKRETLLLIRLDSYFVYYAATNANLHNLSFLNKLGFAPTSLKVNSAPDLGPFTELNLPVFDAPNLLATENNEEFNLKSVIKSFGQDLGLVAELEQLDLLCVALQEYLALDYMSKEDQKVFKYWEDLQRQAFLHSRMQKQKEHLKDHLTVDLASIEYFLYLQAEKKLSPEEFMQFKYLAEFHYVLFSRSIPFLRQLKNSDSVTECLKDVQRVLNFIAEHGLFPIDDTKLPSQPVATFIAKQIFGANEMDTHIFNQIQTDTLYLRRAIVIARRIMYSRGILSRAKQNMSFSKAGSTIINKLKDMRLDDTSLGDLSGVWKLQQTNSVVLMQTPDLFGLIDRLWNISVGKMYGYACRVLFQAITVNVTDEAMTIETSPYLGVQTKLIFVFDSQVRTTTFPELPFETSISNKRYIAWIVRNDKSAVNIRFVFAMELNHDQVQFSEDFPATPRKYSVSSMTGAEGSISSAASVVSQTSSTYNKYNVRGRYVRISLDVMVDRVNNSFSCTIALFFFETEVKRNSGGSKRVRTMKADEGSEAVDVKTSTTAPVLEVSPTLEQLFGPKDVLKEYECFCTMASSSFYR